METIQLSKISNQLTRARVGENKCIECVVWFHVAEFSAILENLVILQNKRI